MHNTEGFKGSRKLEEKNQLPNELGKFIACPKQQSKF